MEIKYIQDRIYNKATDFNKDLIDYLKKKINDKISSLNKQKTHKKKYIDFFEKEIFAANKFRLKYIYLIKNKKTSNDFDFPLDYNKEKYRYRIAIDCLKEYMDFLMEKMKIIRNLKNNKINSSVNKLNMDNEHDINISRKIELALKGASERGYLQSDFRTITSGFRLNFILYFIFNEYKIVLDINDVKNIFLRSSTKKPYKERYIHTEICILNSNIRNQM